MPPAGRSRWHECWLLPGELAVLKRDLEAVIDAGEDSVLFVRLDPRLKPRTLGIARPPVDAGSLTVRLGGIRDPAFFLSAERWRPFKTAIQI